MSRTVICSVRSSTVVFFLHFSFSQSEMFVAHLNDWLKEQQQKLYQFQLFWAHYQWIRWLWHKPNNFLFTVVATVIVSFNSVWWSRLQFFFALSIIKKNNTNLIESVVSRMELDLVQIMKFISRPDGIVMEKNRQVRLCSNRGIQINFASSLYRWIMFY